MTVFDGTNRVYSYTDFTGINRRMSLGLGTYQHEFQANCAAPRWTQLHWSASIPPGAQISFSVQVADTSGQVRSRDTRLQHFPGRISNSLWPAIECCGHSSPCISESEGEPRSRCTASQSGTPTVQGQLGVRRLSPQSGELSRTSNRPIGQTCLAAQHWSARS